MEMPGDPSTSPPPLHIPLRPCRDHPPGPSPRCSRHVAHPGVFPISCPDCFTLLMDQERTRIPSMFAILREWDPSIQRHIFPLIHQILVLGCRVGDTDSMTGMTLFHYAVKSGSPGMADVEECLRTVHQLAQRAEQEDEESIDKPHSSSSPSSEEEADFSNNRRVRSNQRNKNGHEEEEEDSIMIQMDEGSSQPHVILVSGTDEPTSLPYDLNVPHQPYRSQPFNNILSQQHPQHPVLSVDTVTEEEEGEEDGDDDDVKIMEKRANGRGDNGEDPDHHHQNGKKEPTNGDLKSDCSDNGLNDRTKEQGNDRVCEQKPPLPPDHHGGRKRASHRKKVVNKGRPPIGRQSRRSRLQQYHDSSLDQTSMDHDKGSSGVHGQHWPLLNQPDNLGLSPLHTAVLFDVAPVLDYLLTISDRIFIDSPCTGFFDGTGLHVAAANLCLDSLKVLLSHGADVHSRDNRGWSVLDCVPTTVQDPEAQDVVNDMRQVLISCLSLRHLMSSGCTSLNRPPGEGHQPWSLEEVRSVPVTGKVVLQALDMTLGEKVLVNGSRVGVLRYCGATQFASGIWAGVELQSPDGKHDGSINGVTYFKCSPLHGICTPINRICKIGRNQNHQPNSLNSIRCVNFPGVNVSNASPKIDTGLLPNRRPDPIIGDRVLLTDRRKGCVRFKGETDFAPGIWLGIELDQALGKNDGSVQGKRYFQCPPGFGLFASVTRVAYILKPRFREGSEDDSDRSLSCGSFDPLTGRSPNLTPKVTRRNGHSRTRASPQPSPDSPSLTRSPMKGPGSSSVETPALTIGTNVLVHNEMGCVRYIGPIHFEMGIWLGIELRHPNGRNDGSVAGKRYFSCKPMYGLVVKPRSVSVRGINGAKLIPDEPSPSSSNPSSLVNPVHSLTSSSSSYSPLLVKTSNSVSSSISIASGSLHSPALHSAFHTPTNNSITSSLSSSPLVLQSTF